MENVKLSSLISSLKDKGLNISTRANLLITDGVLEVGWYDVPLNTEVLNVNECWNDLTKCKDNCVEHYIDGDNCQFFKK